MAASPAIAPVDLDEAPYPPRYWWFKRILVAVAGLFVFLIAVRLWWGWVAERRLQTEIERIVASGEPIYPEDFDPKEGIPDEQNAAKLLEEAERLLSGKPPFPLEAEAAIDTSSGSEVDWDAVRRTLENDADLFRLLRRVRELPFADWNIRMRSPALDTSMRDDSSQRVIVKLLAVAAADSHFSGRNDEAAEYLIDLLAQARSIEQRPTLISQLVAWAAEGLALSAAERFLIPNAPGDSVDHTARQPSKEEISRFRLITRFLEDETSLTSGMNRALQCERMFQVDILHEFQRGTYSMSTLYGWQGGVQASLPDVVWNTVLAPAIRMDVGLLLADARIRIHAIESGRPLDGILRNENEPADAEWTFLVHPFRSDSNNSLDQAIRYYILLQTKRRLTSVGLAARLFQAEQGYLPDRLEELVPRYLAGLPGDPMSREARVFGYIRNTTHPLIYSVGENGTDEGGAYPQSGRYFADRTADFPFFLDGFRPDAQPSANGAEDDGEVPAEYHDTGKDDAEEKEP